MSLFSRLACVFVSRLPASLKQILARSKNLAKNYGADLVLLVRDIDVSSRLALTMVYRPTFSGDCQQNLLSLSLSTVSIYH